MDTNHPLTDAAMAAIQQFWEAVADLEDTQPGAQVASHWHDVANVCAAFGLQHELSAMDDESAAFVYLQDLAMVRKELSTKRIQTPRLAIARSMDDALK